MIQQISQLVGGLDPNQIRTLHQVLGERVQGQGRMVPDFLVKCRDPRLELDILGKIVQFYLV